MQPHSSQRLRNTLTHLLTYIVKTTVSSAACGKVSTQLTVYENNTGFQKPHGFNACNNNM